MEHSAHSLPLSQVSGIGFDPSDSPVTAGHVIRGFLQALGIQAGQIPSEPQAQIGLYRSVLAGKRMLIILDNARDEQQVRPLQALTVFCELGNKLRQAQTLSNLGLVLSRQRRYREARDHHRRALALSRELGDRNREGIALANLGHVLRHQQALDMYRELDNLPDEARALNDLGQVLHASGQSQQAAAHHTKALGVPEASELRAAVPDFHSTANFALASWSARTSSPARDFGPIDP